MLIDTHCHINVMVKEQFDIPLPKTTSLDTLTIVAQAAQVNVTRIINVGTSLVESNNCVALAQLSTHLFAAVGIHPNDCTENWRADFKQIEELVKHKEDNKIVGIGECGIDRYREHNLARQQDAFKAHIELALHYKLPLIIHSREAAQETLEILDEYRNHGLQGTMHCFSYDSSIAQEAINFGLVLGIGGTVTYPKNEELRSIVTKTSLKHIVLETDAPFLPPQTIRGKRNHPEQIATIAHFIASMRGEPFDEIAQITTANAIRIFNCA